MFRTKHFLTCDKIFTVERIDNSGLITPVFYVCVYVSMNIKEMQQRTRQKHHTIHNIHLITFIIALKRF